MLNMSRYEPLSHLIGSEYFLHAYGPIYALSVEVVASLAALPNNRYVQSRLTYAPCEVASTER